jgi:hypothetical protein
METINVNKFSVIPYLQPDNLAGRFICTLCFYDDGWHSWADVGDRLMRVQMWPAEASYFGIVSEAETDLCFHFTDLFAQRASYAEIGRPFVGLQDDIYNFGASLAKVRWLHDSRSGIGSGVGRMVRTEIEFIVAICRSIFDLLQEIVSKLWVHVSLRVAPETKKNLKETYSDTLLYKGSPSNADKLIERFGMPRELADCYVRSSDFFITLRQFRDNIVHRGSQVQGIFEGNDGFLIRKALVPFRDIDIWRPEERTETELVPLLPALGYVISETLGVCEDFSLTIGRIIDLLPPIAPGMRLFMRGYFNEVLIGALDDVKERTAAATQT